MNSVQRSQHNGALYLAPIECIVNKYVIRAHQTPIRRFSKVLTRNNCIIQCVASVSNTLRNVIQSFRE